MKKRVLNLVMALVMALALLPGAALAAEAEVIWTEYSEIFSFSEGLAPAEAFDKSARLDPDDLLGSTLDAIRYGFIDKTGQVVIPLEYDNAYGFSDGLACVEKDGKVGFIDKTGQVVIPLEYDEAFDFSEGLAAVWKDGKGSVIDKIGKEVFPLDHEWAHMFSEGLLRVRQNGKYGFVDTSGAVIIPPKYDDAWSFSNGLALVRQDEQWGFIDKSGVEVVPPQYYYAYSFSEGLAPVQDDVAWGFIDQSGQVVIPLEYGWAYGFSDGLACVEKDGKEGFIDKTGQVVIPSEYEWCRYFSEGLAAARNRNDRWGFLDKTGKVVVPLQYDYVKDFSDGVAVVQKGDTWGILKNPLAPPANIAYAATQAVNVDGVLKELQAYALKDAAGNATNYVKVRDVAHLLDGTAAQFNVGWDSAVNLETGKAYTTRNGQENKTLYSGDRTYTASTAATMVDGVAVELRAFILTDDAGNGSTYYKLRDLGQALGFNVGWTAQRGMFIESNKPYDPND